MAKTKTKAPAPKAKLADPRNEALERMTKAELVRTVKTLDKRVTKLLNQIATLEADNTRTPEPNALAEPAKVHYAGAIGFVHSAAKFPWET